MGRSGLTVSTVLHVPNSIGDDGHDPLGACRTQQVLGAKLCCVRHDSVEPISDVIHKRLFGGREVIDGVADVCVGGSVWVGVRL